MRWAGFVCLLSCIACNDDRIAKLEKQTTELQQHVASLQKTGQLDNQAKCSQAAKAWFDEHWGRPDKDTLLLTYVNHYSVKNNQCFIRVEFHFNTGRGPGWVNNLQLYDVYENQKYGEVSEDHDIENGELTQQVRDCLVSGQTCKSVEEYNNLSRQFLSD